MDDVKLSRFLYYTRVACLISSPIWLVVSILMIAMTSGSPILEYTFFLLFPGFAVSVIFAVILGNIHNTSLVLTWISNCVFYFLAALLVTSRLKRFRKAAKDKYPDDWIE